VATPNDKLATYGLDDPEVEGVACHFTVPEKCAKLPHLANIKCAERILEEKKKNARSH
jgi:catabolite regulation protein CreA